MIDISELRRLEAEAKYASTTTEFVVAAHKLFDALPELLKVLEEAQAENASLQRVNKALGNMLEPHGGGDVG